MEVQQKNEEFINDKKQLQLLDEVELGIEFKEKFTIEPKRIKKLGKRLINSFLEPNDSEKRRKYIRDLIYGNNTRVNKNKIV
tara:strand:+ start:1231 stop:1476 length:246 start_codon:yes stop_codon:yes gene_type:complete